MSCHVVARLWGSVDAKKSSLGSRGMIAVWRIWLRKHYRVKGDFKLDLQA